MYFLRVIEVYTCTLSTQEVEARESPALSYSEVYCNTIFHETRSKQVIVNVFQDFWKENTLRSSFNLKLMHIDESISML